jgi:hypothetical protein
MSEFCAGVKILLERMKSNPEDFEIIQYDIGMGRDVRGRFYNFAQSIEGIILGTVEKGRPYRDWHYFTDEERQALIAGFKEMKRAKFDKEIMERVFDEHYIERQREEIHREYQPAQQNMAAKQHIYNDIVAQQQAQNSVLGGLMGLGVGGAGGAGVFK